jgi:hypothetical protein
MKMTVSHGKSSLKMKDCYGSGANNDVGMTREEMISLGTSRIKRKATQRHELRWRPGHSV